ncbi:hypothetical protein HQ535_10960 [bacterium]|nr:hypothetical protein [bacterium]
MTQFRETILDHIQAAFAAHRDLASNLPPDAFGQTLGVPSNTIGAQFWCVVGARESYTAALQAGEWAGFTCTLPAAETTSGDSVVGALDRSATEFSRSLPIDDWTDARRALLLDLLEHEVQHQGQLIRYVYGLGLDFPRSWSDRWAL